MSQYRALSLSTQFGLVATIILGCGMTVLGSWVANRIESGVLKNTASTAVYYLHHLVEPYLQPLAERDTLPAASTAALESLVRNTHLMTAIKVWGPHGNVIYSTQPANIGKTYPITPKLARAWQGHIEAEFNSLTDAENEIERRNDLPLMEIYAPVRATGTERIIAVAEIYAIGTRLMNEVESARRQSWLVVALLTLFMLASLFGIVRRGSRTIREQQQALTLRVSDLSELLAKNRELQARIADANRRSEVNTERFLRRIGAELHDGPAQLIGLALLRLDSIQASTNDPPRQSGRTSVTEVVRTALTDALAEIRNLSAGLTLPELESASLSEALRLAVRNHERRTGTNVDCGLPDNLPNQAPASLKTCLYRFTQEALNNAFRHAGGVGQKLSASFIHGTLQVEVRDSGSGLGTKKDSTGGLGLAWLSDRIESLGGTLKIESSEGSGTVLTARFKL